MAQCSSTGVKSTFTSHRSNRFNNVFENPVFVKAHQKDAIHILLHRVSHSNNKLLSIVYDLQDKTVMSFVAPIAFLGVHFT